MCVVLKELVCFLTVNPRGAVKCIYLLIYFFYFFTVKRVQGWKLFHLHLNFNGK